MNAAQFFGISYREATRKPGDPARRYSYKSDEDDEVRRPRPEMRTLGDQTEDSEEEASRRLRFSCPECETENIIRLPKNLALAEGEEEDEEEARTLVQARCSSCGEGPFGVEPPAGMKYVSRRAASEAFARNYGRAIEASWLRHMTLPAM